MKKQNMFKNPQSHKVLNEERELKLAKNEKQAKAFREKMLKLEAKR